jgi:glucokinase
MKRGKKIKKIAVDLGGTNLRIGIVKGNKIIKYVKKNTPKNKQALLKELTDSISEFIDKDVVGVGIASPGPLENGIIKNTPNLPIKNFNLKKFLQKKFKIRVEIENDANCVAIAEAKLGCKKRNFFVLTLGTGVGGGIIINKKLYTGKGLGGELGHIILDKDKDMENLWKFYREQCVRHFGRVMLVKELLKRRDNKSKQILSGMSDVLSKGIASLANIFDPEVVILSGGVRETGKKFLNLVKKDVKKYIFLPRELNIKWSSLKHPGILGASLLID